MDNEIENLDALLGVLGAAEAALAGQITRGEITGTAAATSDPWWVTSLKTVAVYFVLALTASCSVFAFVLDLFGLVFGYDFFLLRSMWGWSWSDVTIDWYWERATPTGIFVGIFLILLAYLPNFVPSHQAARERSNTSEPPKDESGA